jgi:hypothetical protein
MFARKEVGMPTLDERFSKIRPPAKGKAKAKAKANGNNKPNTRGNRNVKTQFAVRLQGAGTAGRRKNFVTTQKEKRQVFFHYFPFEKIKLYFTFGCRLP